MRDTFFDVTTKCEQAAMAGSGVLATSFIGSSMETAGGL
jgi:hypothetical protein